MHAARKNDRGTSSGMPESGMDDAAREALDFQRIMEAAGDESCPPEALYDESPGYADDAETQLLSPLYSHMDDKGNPTWMHIAPLERDEEHERLDRRTSLRDGREPDSASLFTDLKRDANTRRGYSSKKGVRRRGPYRKGNGRERQGPGLPERNRPRPLYGMIRILLVTAVLGVVYHFLAGLGLVPKLW